MTRGAASAAGGGHVPASRRTGMALGALLAVALLAAVAVPAGAESAAEARQDAAAAAAAVAALAPRIQAATEQYEAAVADVGAAVTVSVGADRRADALAQVAATDERRERVRFRVLYMSGGAAGVWGSVLQAGDATDALRRFEQAGRVVTVGARSADRARGVAQQASLAADATGARVQTSVATAANAAAAYRRVEGLLAAAEAEMASLNATAQRLEAAEAAAAALARLRQQATAGATAAAAKATARTMPADYFALYRQAAATCPGLRWEVVAAIGQVETGHGTNVKESYAGAQGPMQFMPRTFAAYGVDGGGDGRVDIWDPADSVFSAANYLCANGAGKPNGLRRAIWHYNHADWYVAMVIRIADQLAIKNDRPLVSTLPQPVV